MFPFFITPSIFRLENTKGIKTKLKWEILSSDSGVAIYGEEGNEGGGMYEARVWPEDVLVNKMGRGRGQLGKLEQ